jgi:hypothetical protein
MVFILPDHNTTVSAPCFECSVRARDRQIMKFINNLPEEWWLFARQRVMRPIIAMVVNAGKVSLGLDPLWLDQVPPACNEHRGPKKLYHEVCMQLHDHANRPNMRRVNFLLETIVAVFLPPFVSKDVYVKIWTQLFELTGRNRVFANVMEHVEMRDEPTIADLGSWLRVIGAEDYGRMLLEGVQTDIFCALDTHSGKTRKRTRDLESTAAHVEQLLLRIESKGSAQRRLAVAMALDPRLGQNSWLGQLDPGVVRMCVQMTDVPKLLRWSDMIEFH